MMLSGWFRRGFEVVFGWFRYVLSGSEATVFIHFYVTDFAIMGIQMANFGGTEMMTGECGEKEDTSKARRYIDLPLDTYHRDMMYIWEIRIGIGDIGSIHVCKCIYVVCFHDR